MTPRATSLHIVRIALRDAWRRFDSHNGWSKASHVAMAMMLALFPFCIFALSLAGQLGGGLDVNDMIAFVYGAWPKEIADPITREVKAVLSASGAKTTIFGALLAIYFASNGVDAVRGVVADAYRDKDPRPAWRRRLLCIGFVLAGGVALTLAGAAAVGLPLYANAASGDWTQGIKAPRSFDTLRAVISTLMLCFAVYACHAWLPGERRPARTILPGVLLTIALWAVAGKAFGFYFSHFSSYSVTYAGLAGVMAALVFLYVMAAIFVFGAEFNGRLQAARRAAKAGR